MVSIQHIIRRALYSLWENLYLNTVATGVIAAALLLTGVYMTVHLNVTRIVETWERDVHVSAYFHPDVSEQRRFALRDEIGRDARVAQVRYVSEADAQEWLVERIEGIEAALSELGPRTLPASLEITLNATTAQPGIISSYVQELEGPDFSDVDYGLEWIQRFNAFLSLLKLLGAVLGLLILTAALFLVINTVHLVVYSRRNEVEIQKLVGATALFITSPFLIEGAVQGLFGSGLALLGLWGVHRLLVERLQLALDLQVAGELQFLPPDQMIILSITGVALGIGAALVAVNRFLTKAP